MESENELRIMEDIRRGRKEAFAELVDPLIARAYHTALAILRSPHLAEEAVQNALIEAYQTIRSGKEIRRFRGWFSRVIANRALDLARQESRFIGLDIDSVVVGDNAASPVDLLLRKEQSGEILQAVMSLDIQQRTVVVLYYFQEMKIEEIAQTLNVSEGTVKTRLYRARIHLGKMMSFPELKSKVVPIR
ncbi:RNA polymerase sigma factor [Paenibacillus thermoaerophilus]|uniref:RNA polymerase sigma factor n=1 Tax=Paenibacillus thermoaerophilus TaxID=1215385 RepID=A0ABW2UY94_9BACL|nr:RNA polymerase sigma factor [Paenibacillus thermoaerophilus]TMV08104.1 RNA polymerase sigma factor [Paenibacillus thermoaerophilus]